jgi:hypothetical protein
MIRRALPFEFRSREVFESDTPFTAAARPSQTFLDGLRERRPELFVDEATDEVVFPAALVASQGHGNAQPPVNVTAPVTAPTGFVVDVTEDFTVGWGGIADPPSHDFPI